MEPLAYLANSHISRISRLGTTAHSALPDAPVVITPDRRVVTIRVRANAAAALRRLADLVAPPARTPLCADGH
jgi:hypothetical protein